MSSFRPQKSLMSTFRFSSYLPYYVFEGLNGTRTGLVRCDNPPRYPREYGSFIKGNLTLSGVKISG